MTFARFFQTEVEAREACAAWASAVRKDWDVSEVSEIVRRPETAAMFGPLRCRSAVAPSDQPSTPDVPARQLIVEAEGDFARYGEDYRGTARASFRAVFPA